MKILIAGDGKVGATLTRQLSEEGYDLTLIDSNQQVLESTVNRYDVLTVYGNCASMETLRRAGAQQADLLIAVTSADEVNLLCCTTAHTLNPHIHTIARIRNPEYDEQSYTMRDIFALSMTVNPEKQAAQEIERLLQYPGFLKRETFAKGRVEIVELRIDETSRLCGVSLSSLSRIIPCKVLVCTVLRDGRAVTPDGTFILQEGDRIFVTAPTNELTSLIHGIGIPTRKVNRVMLAGGGRISFYLAQQLEKSGMAVQIIEQNALRCQTLAEQLPAAQILQGDASSLSLLQSEGLEHCDALVTLTGLDELNMILSLCAIQHGVPQVITKLGRLENMEVPGNLPLGSLICPKELCCASIVRYVRAMKNQSGAAVAIHSIADGQAEAIEFTAPQDAPFCGVPLKKLKLRPNVRVACICRGTRTEIPNGDSTLFGGDTVIVVTSGGTILYQLGDIFVQ